MEYVHVEQNFEMVDPSAIYSRVADMKAGGYRLGQMCGVVLDDDTYELIYTFDKDHQLYNLKVDIPIDAELESVTEIQDLFGIKFNHSALDYGGTFFKVSEPTPWKPKK